MSLSIHQVISKPTQSGAKIDWDVQDRVVVRQVTKEGVADRAGLKVGDQNVSVDEQPIAGPPSLVRAV